MRYPFPTMRGTDSVVGMTTSPEHQQKTIYGAIVDEIHAEMGRKRLSQVDLAARLHVSQPWVNRRLKGHTDITFPELEAIAAALGLKVGDLVSRAQRDTAWYPGRAAIPTPRRPFLYIVPRVLTGAAA